MCVGCWDKEASKQKCSTVWKTGICPKQILCENEKRKEFTNNELITLDCCLHTAYTYIAHAEAEVYDERDRTHVINVVW